jgi:hypothetical protein
MKLSTSLLFLAGVLYMQTGMGQNAGGCEPDGNVQFVCGPVSPEDLIAIPESPWIVASGMEDDGYLYLVNVNDHDSTTLFPVASSVPRHDRATYGSCPGPVSGQFRPHGISLRPGSNGMHTLYVVRHGEREAIEVFEVDASVQSPTLTWIGCVVAPESVSLNSVVALPEGGFAVTNFRMPVGELWEWHAASDWARVPGSETSGPNGIEVSPDGRWFYIGGWGTRSLIRLSRGVSPVQSDAVDVGHHVDNVRWGPDGSLFAAGHLGATQSAIGQCMGQGQCESVTSRVTEVDPQNLTAREIVRYPSNDLLILGTVAIQVGQEVWVGGIAGGERIARFPAASAR